MNSSKAATPASGGRGGKGRAVSAPGVATVRHALLTLVVKNDLFTPAEQQQAEQSAADCQDVTRLALLLADARRTAAERGAGPAHEQQRAEIRRLLAHPSGATAYMKAKLARLLESGTYADARRTLGRLQWRAQYADWRAARALLPLPDERRQGLLSRRSIYKVYGYYSCPIYPLPPAEQGPLTRYMHRIGPGLNIGTRLFDDPNSKDRTFQGFILFSN